MEGRSQKPASQPRERERDLSGMQTSEAAEGNEVICNKSNYFEKTSFTHVFITGRLEKTTQKRGVNRLPLPSLQAGVQAGVTHSVLLQGNDPCSYCIWRNISFPPHFKSISGLSEGAGLKVITAPLFPLINYMNNIWDNALLNIYV